jgi:hypothetical protein
MKILLIAQEPVLAPEKIVTGNAIRTRQLSSSLMAAGHEIIHIWYDKDKNGAEGSFGDRDELRGLLLSHQPEACLVSYWELMDMVPFELDMPVILDFLAPRPLEQLFENPEQLPHDLHRLKVNLSKIDLMLVGNSAQKHLATLPLLSAGFDMRETSGIAVVPLAAEVIGAPASDPEVDGWKLVSGGVNWPWRNSQPYWEAFNAMDSQPSGKLELIRFGGNYSLNSEQTDENVKTGSRPMLPWPISESNWPKKISKEDTASHSDHWIS